MAYITNDTARKACFKKRKKGFIKKVSELSTLCDVNVCAIIYSPYDTQPEVWPSPEGVQRVLAQFNSMPVSEQSKKMFNQSTFLTERIEKAQEQFKNQKKENRKMEMERVMSQSLCGKPLEGLMLMDLKDLEWTIDQNIKQVQSRMKSLREEALRNQNQEQGAPAAADQQMVHVVKTEAM